VAAHIFPNSRIFERFFIKRGWGLEFAPVFYHWKFLLTRYRCLCSTTRSWLDSLEMSFEKKPNTHNKTKRGPHSLFLQTGNLPSSSCVSIRIFNLTSQIDIEWCRLCCFMGYSEIASWCGFPPHWRPWGDFVDRRFLERDLFFFFSMNLRNLHNTQEAGKWWAFLYEILIIFFFHSQIFP
jgi:hypothetical protein